MGRPDSVAGGPCGLEIASSSRQTRLQRGELGAQGFDFSPADGLEPEQLLETPEAARRGSPLGLERCHPCPELRQALLARHGWDEPEDRGPRRSLETGIRPVIRCHDGIDRGRDDSLPARLRPHAARARHARLQRALADPGRGEGRRPLLLLEERHLLSARCVRRAAWPADQPARIVVVADSHLPSGYLLAGLGGLDAKEQLELSLTCRCHCDRVDAVADGRVALEALLATVAAAQDDGGPCLSQRTEVAQPGHVRV